MPRINTVRAEATELPISRLSHRNKSRQKSIPPQLLKNIFGIDTFYVKNKQKSKITTSLGGGGGLVGISTYIAFCWIYI